MSIAYRIDSEGLEKLDKLFEDRKDVELTDSKKVTLVDLERQAAFFGGKVKIIKKAKKNG